MVRCVACCVWGYAAFGRVPVVCRGATDSACATTCSVHKHPAPWHEECGAHRCVLRGNAEKIKKAHPAYSPKKIAEKVEQDWVDDQCRARDTSKMCKLSGGGVKDGCKWSCSGPIDKQPELCGFNAAFNYLMQDTSATVSDDCVAYSSKA